MLYLKKTALITAAFMFFSCNNDRNQSEGAQAGAATPEDNMNVPSGDTRSIPAPDSVTAQLVAENFTSPLYLTQPAGDDRLFVIEQTGQIFIIKNGEKLQKPFLNIKDRIIELKPEHEERGLLGLAFHPDFKNNGKFYVYYSAPLRPSAPEGWNCTSTISEFRVSSSNPDGADASTEKVLLQIDKPQGNHNAGTVAFGPDGYLYISIGDGGGADDKDKGHVEDWYKENRGGNGQDVKQNLLGSILRIDVNNGSPYAIPADNPFADGKNGLKEIYAYGLRNPYRYSFAPDGSLIAADAGQELYEEINVITKGGNYGWNVKEGRHCFNAADHKHPLDSCPSEDAMGNTLIDPVLEFKNTMSFPQEGLGIVSVGGVVYNADGVAGLKNKYLFGVWTQHHGNPDGGVFAAHRTGSDWQYKKLWFKNRPKGELGHFVLGFGQDNNGEAYVLTTDENGPKGNTGKVYKLVQ